MASVGRLPSSEAVAVSGALAAEADVTLAMVLLLSPAGSRPVSSRGPPVARKRLPSRHPASQIIYAIAIAIVLSNCLARGDRQSYAPEPRGHAGVTAGGRAAARRIAALAHDARAAQGADARAPAGRGAPRLCQQRLPRSLGRGD